MKEFQLLRYIKKLWPLICLVCIAGIMVFYVYISDRQSYVARTTLRYSNKEALDGLTPSGDLIDPKEVFSANVIADAQRDTPNLNISPTEGSVREIIPKDIETRKNALLAKGEEFIYYSDTYEISYNSTVSENRAHTILDSLLNSYFVYYGKTYVNPYHVSVSAQTLKSDGLDYLERVELIDDFLTIMMDYVGTRMTYSPDFRSVDSGCSFSDLYAQYELLANNDLPGLYAAVFSNAVTSDRDSLIKKYDNWIVTNNTKLGNLEKRLVDVEELLRLYSEKNRENMSYHWNISDEAITGTTYNDASYVLQSVYDYNTDKTQTTYDDLIILYANLNDSINSAKLDNEYNQFVIDNLQGVENGGAGESALEAKLDSMVETLSEMEKIVNTTVHEYNKYLAAQNLMTVSSIIVSKSINIKMYMLIAAVLFLVVGCGLAILLGRGADFAEYYMFIEHKTGLPNRIDCDRYMEKYSNTPIARPTVCIVIRLTNLAKLNREQGREVGDKLLSDVGKILKDCCKDYGYIACNTVSDYIAFFQNCSVERGQSFLIMLGDIIQQYNEEYPNAPIQYETGMADSETLNTYSIRPLLRAANINMKK